MCLFCEIEAELDNLCAFLSEIPPLDWYCFISAIQLGFGAQLVMDCQSGHLDGYCEAGFGLGCLFGVGGMMEG